jgi:carboxypeptidase Q
MKARLPFALLTISALLNAQTPTTTPAAPDPRLKLEMQRIQAHALNSDYAYTRLAHISNNIGPRLSGSKQAERAVAYVAEEMRKLGAEVTLHKVMVPHWVRGVETAELVEWPGMAPGTTHKVVLTALGGSGATPAEGITADVLVVKDIAELQSLAPDKVKGTIVVFTSKYDVAMAEAGLAFQAYSKAVGVRGRGALEAAKLGAVASVIRSVGSANFRLPHTGAMRPWEAVTPIAAAAAAYEDIDTIAHLATQGQVRMHLTLTPQTLPDVESANVIADIKGTEHPEQIVIVSGHLDSWDLGTGAIDDGAGVTAAMQVLQTIKQLKLKPKRTIRMIAWMNEENGGKGSDGYIKDVEKDIPNHVAAIEMDSGAGHALGFRAHIPLETVEKLKPMTEVLDAQGAGLIQRVDTSPGADIENLDKKGVHTYGVWNDGRDYFHYHHTAADTFDKVNPKHLQENASAMAVLAWWLANQSF